MGASAIEQIYLPNCLCASGIKPSKSQISKEDWVFKLARSTYTQAGEISPRTTPAINANAALVSPRMTPAITGVHGSRHRTTLQVRDT